jgi:hypothetical protein
VEGVARPPSQVAAAAGKALTARPPKPRYRVGFEGAVLEWADLLLPTRAKDRVLRGALRL